MNADMLSQLEIDLRLSSQRALLGAVTSGLCAVSTELVGKTIHWRCFFFSSTEKEAQWENLSVAATELIADFPDTYCIEEEYLVVEFRKGSGDETYEIEHLQHLVYLAHTV